MSQPGAGRPKKLRERQSTAAYLREGISPQHLQVSAPHTPRGGAVGHPQVLWSQGGGGGEGGGGGGGGEGGGGGGAGREIKRTARMEGGIARECWWWKDK